MLNGGGANDFGTIIEYNLNTNTVTKKVEFDLNKSGAWPSGNLVLYNGPVRVSPVSLDDMSFTLFPNPAVDHLMIALDDNEAEVSVEVLTIDGRLILNQQFKNSSHLKLNLQHLASGSYFLKVRSEDDEVMKRFVKR